MKVPILVLHASGNELEAEIAADLAARIGRGDRRAETELVRRYQRGLLYLLRRRARDSELALDLCQDTFRIAIEKLRISGIDEPTRIAAFLRGIALNLIIAHARKERRRATTADSEAVESMADEKAERPFDNVSGEQVQGLIKALLEELPVARDREVLIRVYLEDEDKAAICAALGIDSTHFNRVLFRAKQRFRELLRQAEQKNKFRLVGS